MNTLRLMVLSLAALLSPASAQAGWPPVPPMDWSHVQPTDFSDNELVIPYMLEHFHTVANAVVEEGPTRGFLKIKVARDAKDNEPYNARIEENNLPLAYFYCTKKPWNPYYGSEAVKVRLEAMLDYWCGIESPEGMFSEYKPNGWGLAPTGFGVQAMGQTLALLHAGGPTIDQAILDRTMAAQRKAIMCMLTNDQMYKWASDWSNQFTGVYFAALSYLRVKDDAEMRDALEKGVKRCISVTQGQTGLLYEAGGLDFGYSHVHENNIRVAWPLLGDDAAVRDAIIAECQLYNRWLGYNLVLQPDRSGYFVNAGVDCRTSFSYAAYTSKPPSETVEAERCFAATDTEHKNAISHQREQLTADWPHFKPLVVPGNKSYLPNEIFTAVLNRDSFFPTAAQRDAAIAQLPYLAKTNWTTQGYDPRNYVYTFVRRPTYYGIFNSGRVRVAGHQNLGLGLLWNDKLGCVLQAVGGSGIAWGTLVGDSQKVVETKNIAATIAVGKVPVEPKPGYQDLAASDVEINYALPDGGSKQITFSGDSISVTVNHAGSFLEQLPLVVPTGAKLNRHAGSIELSKAGSTFEISFDPAVEAKYVHVDPTGDDPIDRAMIQLPASEKLTYTLTFK